MTACKQEDAAGLGHFQKGRYKLEHKGAISSFFFFFPVEQRELQTSEAHPATDNNSQFTYHSHSLLWCHAGWERHKNVMLTPQFVQRVQGETSPLLLAGWTPSEKKGLPLIISAFFRYHNDRSTQADLPIAAISRRQPMSRIWFITEITTASWSMAGLAYQCLHCTFGVLVQYKSVCSGPQFFLFFHIFEAAWNCFYLQCKDVANLD